MASAPLAAQDSEAPPALEDLIPDSAVENPEDWAGQGTEGEEASDNSDVPDPDTPIELPEGNDLPWPSDIEIDNVEALEADEEIEFDLDETPAL